MTYQPPRGTRDFLPEDMIKRNRVLDIIRSTFEKWGFDPLQTPAFEDWKLLSAKGGQDIKNEIYYFKDKSERELGLRFDFTVPLARVAASNPGLPKPFRRYQMGPVWRYDRPGSGRYREFWQCDVDVIGSSFPESDALCVAVACDTLRELGVKDFSIRINSRKIVEAFLVTIGLKEKVVDVLRSIDKLAKIGEKKVAEELNKKKVSQEKIRKIMNFVKIDNLSEAGKMIGKEELGKKGVEEIEAILSFIDVLGFFDFVKFDLSLVRGLEYYTGPVFEISSGLDISVGGGGRYDRLIEGFGGKSTPAVGISFGLDRLMLVLEDKKDAERTNTKIYVASVGNVKKDTIRVARELISLGVPAEFDLMDRSLSKQLDYANSKGILFVIVIGEKEIRAGKAKLRNMRTGEEKEISLNSLEEIKKYA